MSGTEILRRCRNRSDGIRESASPLALLRTARLLQRFVAGMIYSIVVSVWAACACIRRVIFFCFCLSGKLNCQTRPVGRRKPATRRRRRRGRKRQMWMSLCVKAIAAARQLDSTYYKMPPTAVPSRISKLVGRGPSTRPCRHRSVNVRKRQQKKRAMKMYPKQRKQKGGAEWKSAGDGAGGRVGHQNTTNNGKERCRRLLEKERGIFSFFGGFLHWRTLRHKCAH